MTVRHDGVEVTSSGASAFDECEPEDEDVGIRRGRSAVDADDASGGQARGLDQLGESFLRVPVQQPESLVDDGLAASFALVAKRGDVTTSTLVAILTHGAATQDGAVGRR